MPRPLSVFSKISSALSGITFMVLCNYTFLQKKFRKSLFLSLSLSLWNRLTYASPLSYTSTYDSSIYNEDKQTKLTMITCHTHYGVVILCNTCFKKSPPSLYLSLSLSLSLSFSLSLSGPAMPHHTRTRTQHPLIEMNHFT